MYFNGLLTIIGVIIFVLLVFGFIRWIVDSVNYQLVEKRQVKNDEARFEQRFAMQQITFPTREKQLEIVHVDTFIEELIASGELGKARDHLREMKEVAREMKDLEAIRNYEAYENLISQLRLQAEHSSRE